MDIIFPYDTVETYYATYNTDRPAVDETDA